MRSNEYPAFQDAAIALFAAESARAGRVLESASLAWSEAETMKILPEGIETPNHLFYTIREDETETVGYIWCGRDRDKKTRMFLYTILIFENFRSRGYGSRALQLLEGELKAKGYDSIGLHVYSFNEQAVRLYRKLGYRETNLVMSKEI
jgi:ribosomal protein S18 acetylase RimI-like enzyme